MGMLIAIGVGIAGLVGVGIVVAVVLSRRSRHGAGPAPVHGGYPHQSPQYPMAQAPAYPPAPAAQPPHHPYAQQPPFPGQ